MTDSTAVVDAPTEEATKEAAKKLNHEVSIETTGPCKRRIKVRIPQSDIDAARTQAVSRYSKDALVPGFRKGKVPPSLVAKRFREELATELRQTLLTESLEQLSEEHKLDPINEPDFNIANLEVPEQGDFEYEFDIEVRPEFDLPQYTGLTIDRPVRETTEGDVDEYISRFASQYGQLKDVEGSVTADSTVTADLVFVNNGNVLHRVQGVQLDLSPVLEFIDATLEGFDALLVGANIGDQRSATVTVSSEAQNIELRGEPVEVQFTVKKIQERSKPEVDASFIDRIGFDTFEDLRVEVRSILERQVKYDQRQATRKQVLDKITASANWDLPEDLVRKQVENAMRREILEMRQAGFTPDQIRSKENSLRQESITTTRKNLKEHFVLDKIANEEKIEVEQKEIDAEIHTMAIQSGENSRRVRAQLEKSGMIENLEAQIRERKAVDAVLKTAVFNDVPVAKPVQSRTTPVDLSVSTAGFNVEIADEDEEAAE